MVMFKENNNDRVGFLSELHLFYRTRTSSLC